MEFFKSLLLLETQRVAAKETAHAITVINKIYNEFKRIKRRINAVDIVTTAVNKISNIDPSVVDHIHAAAKKKLTIIIMRCLDLPPWKPLSSKERIYKKLYPLLTKLQNEDPNTTTGANLRDVVMTRLSTAISNQTKDSKIFVAYESKLPESYLRYLFGDKLPEKTYRMASLPLPEDFQSLIEILKINYEKVEGKKVKSQ